MAMSRSAACDLVREWMPAWRAQREHLDRLNRWYRGQNEDPWAPKQSTPELRALRQKASSPHLSLVVTVVAQGLVVDGYRRADAPTDAAPWLAWQANGMDGRQTAIYRAALAHGLAHMEVQPGTPYPVMRGISARRMFVHYGDPSIDEWPLFSLQVDKSGSGHMVQVLDEDVKHFIGLESISGTPEYIESRAHDLGVVPVVTYRNVPDLDGEVASDIEPLIPTAARIDQTTFDRLVVQRYASWKVRTVAGMAEPETDAEKAALKRLLQVGDLLVSESSDTKFGTLAETPLDGFIRAKEADYRELAAVSQTPPVDLLGQVANLSAEALTEARFAAARKRDERKLSFGETHEQALRLVGAAMGDAQAASDFAAQVIWRDVESRNLAAAADALGKLATQLGVPLEMLWEMIPGWTQTDVERAKQLADDADALGKLTAELVAQSSGSTPVDAGDGNAA